MNTVILQHAADLAQSGAPFQQALASLNQLLDAEERRVADGLAARQAAGQPVIEIHPGDLYLLRFFGVDVDMASGQVIPNGAGTMRITESIRPFSTYLRGLGRSESTVIDYETKVGRFTSWLDLYYGEDVIDLDQITMELMDEYGQWLHSCTDRYADHPTNPTKPGGYSKASIAGYIGAVRRWLTWCNERGYCESNPSAHLEKPKWNSRPSSDRVMRRSDLYKMLDQATQRALESGSVRDLALLLFTAETGARRGEIAKLQIKDLNLVKCTAEVSGKTGPRTTDFTEKTAHLLELWLAQREPLVKRWGGGHGFVFCGISPANHKSFGQPLSWNSVYQIFKRLAGQAGVKGPWNPHSLRHLVGQSWTDQGINLELLRQKLGHSSIEITSRFYTHQDISKVQAATQLASLLNGYRADIDPLEP